VTEIDLADATSTITVGGTGGGDKQPRGIAVSPTGPNAGYVYVTNGSGRFASTSVSVIDPTGTVTNIPFDGRPTGVAVAPAGVTNAGYVYVSDYYYGRVYVYDPSSQLVGTIATSAGDLGAIAVSPTGIKAGYVYVADRQNAEVLVISPFDSVNGSTIDTVTVGDDPRSLAISPTGTNAGYVYVGNYNGQTVSVIDPSNTVSTITLGDSVVSPGDAFYPVSVAVSPTGATAGQVYVGGYYGDVRVINPSGNIVGNIGGEWGYKPYSLAVAPTGANAGDIYVGSYGNSTVTVLSPNGTILDTIAVTGPAGIAIAP
jgi:hypothetical protein